MLAGLLFASHPIHTEAVAGVVGRADVGAAFCFLLSLICYVQYCRLRASAAHSSGVVWRTKLWMAGSLGAAAAALLWKEQGVTVLAVLAVYDLCIVHRLRLRQVVIMVLKVRSNFVCGDLLKVKAEKQVFKFCKYINIKADCSLRCISALITKPETQSLYPSWKNCIFVIQDLNVL